MLSQVQDLLEVSPIGVEVECLRRRKCKTHSARLNQASERG
jgi:hypothetical protein